MVSRLITICMLYMYLSGNMLSIQAAGCRMEDFPVQANFDEDRYQGKWYEVSWILQPWIKPEWNYHDFIHNYTKTNYGFSIYSQGRWPANATMCDTPATQKLYSTGGNAKYLYEYKAKDGEVINATHWVVETDYNNYALVIGCREVAPNGTCVAPDGWLWTRCQKVPMSYVTHMEDKLATFCLTKDDFYAGYQTTECRADIPDSCTETDAGASTTAGIAVLVISIAAALMFSHPDT